MNTAQVAHLLGGVSARNVYAFFLVLARVTPLFIVAPGFSSTMLLPRVRSVLAIAIAIGLTPVAIHGQHINTATLAIIGMLIENFIVGLALSYAIACVFGAIQGAGAFADSFGGFSFGATVDPVNGNPGGSMTNIYTMVGLAMFLAIGGDAWTLRGLSATFNAIPLSASVAVKPLLGAMESAGASLLIGAVEIAAPVMLAIVITDIALGMVSKVVPQLNVFAIGFSVKVGVTLLIVGVSLPFLGNWMSNQLEGSLFSTLHALRIG
jgi:flagellar biosynthetic protein FliR